MSIKSISGLFAAVSEIDFERRRIENRFSITFIRLNSPFKIYQNVDSMLFNAESAIYLQNQLRLRNETNKVRKRSFGFVHFFNDYRIW